MYKENRFTHLTVLETESPRSSSTICPASGEGAGGCARRGDHEGRPHGETGCQRLWRGQTPSFLTTHSGVNYLRSQEKDPTP